MDVSKEKDLKTRKRIRRERSEIEGKEASEHSPQIDREDHGRGDW